MTTSNKTTRQPTPQTGPFGFHWRSIARVLRKGKLGVLAIWLTLTLVAVAVVGNLPSVFKAECLMLVVGQKIPEKYVTSTITTAPQERLATISHLILSDERLESIIEAFHLYGTERGVLPQEEVLKRMRDKDIELTLETGLSNTRPDALRISYQAKDPKTAAGVTNRLASLIIEESTRSRKGRAAGTSQFIEDQLRQARQTLDQLDVRVKQYKLAHSGELPQQESSLNESMSRLQQRLNANQETQNRAGQSAILLEDSLSQAESSLAALERTVQEAREEAKRKGAASPVGLGIATAPAKPKSRTEILQEELAALRLRYGNSHPDVRRLNAALAELPLTKGDGVEGAANPGPGKPELPSAQGQETVVLPPGLSTAVLYQKERVASLRAQRELAAKELASARAERRGIEQEIEAYQMRINRLPLREQEMATVTRDYEIAKENYKSLLDKKLSAGMASEMESSQQGEEYTLIEPARVPELPFKPKRPLLYAAGAILSLAISILVVLGLYLPRDKVLGEWELGPGLVVLARVPQIKIRHSVKANLI